jgi:hypothetical protein
LMGLIAAAAEEDMVAAELLRVETGSGCCFQKMEVIMKTAAHRGAGASIGAWEGSRFDS